MMTKGSVSGQQLAIAGFPWVVPSQAATFGVIHGVDKTYAARTTLVACEHRGHRQRAANKAKELRKKSRGDGVG